MTMIGKTLMMLSFLAVSSTLPAIVCADDIMKVTLKESMTLTADTVRFSDIVDADATDIEFIKKFGSLKVTDSQDEATRLDRTRLISILFKAGAPVDDIRIVMSQAVEIERGQKVALGDEQKNQILRVLAADYGVPAVDVTLGDAAILPKISDDQKMLLHFKSIKATDLKRLSRAAFRVTMLDDDGLTQEYTLYVKLGIETQIAQASKSLEPGHVLATDDYILGKQKLSGLSGKLVNIKNLGEGTIKIVSTIERDEILLANSVRLAQRVKEGSTVTLSYKTPFLHIKTVGVVKEGGEVGDVVRVENTQSQQTVTGRLISKDMVEVARVDPE